MLSSFLPSTIGDTGREMGQEDWTFSLNGFALFWETRIKVLGVEGNEKQWFLILGTSHSRCRGRPGWLEKSTPRPLSIQAAEPPVRGPASGPRPFPTRLTVTLESLPSQAPQQGPTVLAEGRAFVIVDFEPVWHVNFESLLVELKKGRMCDQMRVPGFQLWVSWQTL